MFEEKYNNLTGAEKENFKRITSLLLNRTFMVNRFYDKNQGTFRSNSDYRFIDRNKLYEPDTLSTPCYGDTRYKYHQNAGFRYQNK